MTVLVLARDTDPSADRLVEALGKRGVPVFRTDLAAFPQSLTLDARLGSDGWDLGWLGPRMAGTSDGWDGVLATEHRQVRLSEIRSECDGWRYLAAALLVELGRLQIAYTRRIEPSELDDLAGVDTTLHLFQPFQSKLFEARVTGGVSHRCRPDAAALGQPVRLCRAVAPPGRHLGAADR